MDRLLRKKQTKQKPNKSMGGKNNYNLLPCVNYWNFQKWKKKKSSNISMSDNDSHKFGSTVHQDWTVKHKVK